MGIVELKVEITPFFEGGGGLTCVARYVTTHVLHDQEFEVPSFIAQAALKITHTLQ